MTTKRACRGAKLVRCFAQQLMMNKKLLKKTIRRIRARQRKENLTAKQTKTTNCIISRKEHEKERNMAKAMANVGTAENGAIPGGSARISMILTKVKDQSVI